MRNRVTALFLCALLLCCCACARQPQQTDAPAGDTIGVSELSGAIRARGGYFLRAAVLYCGGGADAAAWEVTLDYLRQSTAINLTAEAVDAAGEFCLDGYDLLYVDASVLRRGEQTVSEILRFTENGGFVLLPNVFCNVFPADYLGIDRTVGIDGFPETLSLPAVPEDLRELQELIADFHSLYTSFADAETLKAMDYGFGVRVSTATPIVSAGGAAMYALNAYGRGAVLLTNPLLPNSFSKGAFSLAAFGNQTSFSNTTASCNQLFFADFAAYAAKQIYGFSLGRVFGAYGSPAMSWELHYEEITAFANNSLGLFDPICRQNRQIPSLSLVRNTYTWFDQAETMAYALNRGTGTQLRFEVDRNESAYSSGTHIVAGYGWLQLAALHNCISYFDDKEAENYRLYPCVLDYDGDGVLDAFCGSANGVVYFLRGRGFTGTDGRFCMDMWKILDGVSVPGYSAPAVTDLNGDGCLDLIVGAADGCLYSFYGDGGLGFQPQGVLLNADTSGQCLPCVGDIDGDGTDDIAIGSDKGVLVFYYGRKNGGATAFSSRRMGDMSRACAELGLGKWLSPGLADLNGDGVTDLALGTYDGYVAVFTGDGSGGFAFGEYLTAEDMNYKGNHNLKFGHYCTPVFRDLDGNGTQDLLCGYEEYGMAYPIDSDYFPYRDQLQAQIDTALENDYYIGLHFLTGNYYSADRERYELTRQKEALRSYGVTDCKGANQHTWRMSNFDEAQSLMSLWDAGVLWESGYAPSRGTSIMPQYAAENVIALPFYLMRGGERTILVQNCSVLVYRDGAWTDLSGKYGMPTLIYYHCDMMYKSDDGARYASDLAAQFQKRFGYNFVKEDQLMYSIAAAYNLAVDVQAEEDGFTLRPRALDTGFALYDADAQSAAGLRIDFSSRLRDTMGTDAAVWRRTDRGLALGLDRDVSVRAGAPAEESRILRVNTPAAISASADGAVIEFRDGGMQQAAVRGAATTDDAGWTVDASDGVTVFTAYLNAPTLHITYQEMN